MAEIVNLRLVRKRATRSKAEANAAQARLTHGVSKSERNHATADQEKARHTLDRHRIEPGDRQ